MRGPRDKIPDGIRYYDALPDDALIDVRAVAILRGESVSTVWRRVQRGELDRPIATGPNTTRWRLGAIRRSLRGEAAA